MPSNPEMDLTHATPEQLDKAWDVFANQSPDRRSAGLFGRVLASFRDTIVRQARAQWEQERGTALTDAEIRDIDHAVTHECPTMHRAKYAFADAIIRETHRRYASPRALQREAAAKAWDHARKYAVGVMISTQSNEAERDRYLAREYPSAPPSVTLCDVCGVAVPESPDGVTFSRHAEITDCVRNVAKRAALPPEDSTDGK